MRRSGQIWEASAASPPGEWWIDGGDDDADGEGDGGASYADEVGDGEGDGGGGGGGDTNEFGRHQLLLHPSPESRVCSENSPFAPFWILNVPI